MSSVKRKTGGSGQHTEKQETGIRWQGAGDRGQESARSKAKPVFTTEGTEDTEKINTKFLYKGKVKDEISAGRRIFDLTWKRSG